MAEKQYLDYSGLKTYDAKIKEWVKSLPQAEFDPSDIEASISNLQELIGDKSVEDQITSAIAALVDNAPSNLDTLKELADWISTHGEAAAALVETVAQLGEKIDAVDSKINAFVPISDIAIEALFYEPVTLGENQTVQDAIDNLAAGQKLVLSEDVAEDLAINKNVVIEAENVEFSGKVTVSKDVNATIIGATFSGEVVVQ